jgi:uncharacterized protein YbcI
MPEKMPTIAQEIAQIAMTFQQQCTGRLPESVTVLLGEDTLVVTLHEALSPGEKEMARTPGGAARVHEYHRALFETSSLALHLELKRILGVEVCESGVVIDPGTGRLIEAFPSGAVVQMFRFSQTVVTEAWSSLNKHRAN